MSSPKWNASDVVRLDAVICELQTEVKTLQQQISGLQRDLHFQDCVINSSIIQQSVMAKLLNRCLRRLPRGAFRRKVKAFLAEKVPKSTGRSG